VISKDAMDLLLPDIGLIHEYLTSKPEFIVTLTDLSKRHALGRDLMPFGSEIHIEDADILAGQ